MFGDETHILSMNAVALSALDKLTTYIALNEPSTFWEVNPLQSYFIDLYGLNRTMLVEIFAAMVIICAAILILSKIYTNIHKYLFLVNVLFLLVVVNNISWLLLLA